MVSGSDFPLHQSSEKINEPCLQYLFPWEKRDGQLLKCHLNFCHHLPTGYRMFSNGGILYESTNQREKDIYGALQPRNGSREKRLESFNCRFVFNNQMLYFIYLYIIPFISHIENSATERGWFRRAPALGDRFFVHDMSGKAERSKDAEPEIGASKVRRQCGVVHGGNNLDSA